MTATRHSFTSPLRYPGGKGQLANFMKLVIHENNLYDEEYAEGYAGGAGVACSLLLEEYVSRIHINDFDRAVYAFWHSVLFETEDLCRMICDTDITTEQWALQKRIHGNHQDYSLLEVGFRSRESINITFQRSI